MRETNEQRKERARVAGIVRENWDKISSKTLEQWICAHLNEGKLSVAYSTTKEERDAYYE